MNLEDDHKIYLDDNNYQSEVISANETICVLFTKNWCGMCQISEYVLSRFISKQKMDIQIMLMDVEVNTIIPKQLNIVHIPTLVVYHNGEIIYRIDDFITKNELKLFLHPILEKSYNK